MLGPIYWLVDKNLQEWKVVCVCLCVRESEKEVCFRQVRDVKY